ncbi:hypothetical protein BG006_001501 [Podila minutissima]|uniref:GRF-type domain-containing protein n=1 Tax=Podila minutissima TaxID=64525 RepID=A0A9P5SVN4_9FUNG|nr:hypothetical protein BG006_001501 [Podila minutissima]
MAQTSLPNNTAEDWDFKMATLFSIFESTPERVLHQALTKAHGDLEQAIPVVLSGQLSASTDTTVNNYPKKKQRLVQPRLAAFLGSPSFSSSSSSSTSASSSQSTSALISSPSSSVSNLPSLNDRLRWKDSIDDSTKSRERIRPLVLYNPEDVAKHCPCTLIHNVLDKDLASRLLQVMMVESETWNRNRWWLFERMVESPHKTSYYAEDNHDLAEVSGWTYNGKKQDPPRKFLKEMDEAKLVVRKIVNELRATRDIGTARINITYRLRRPGFAPEDTPVCKCGVAMVLRCVFKNRANYGKYFYMCYAAGSQEGKTCGEFHWVDMEDKLGLVKLEEEGKDPSQDTSQDVSNGIKRKSSNETLKDKVVNPLDLTNELLDDLSPIQALEESEAE